MSMFHSPKITKNGLSVYIDARNTKSYPQSGNTWYDLSGNNNDFTFSNGTYNSDGYIQFASGSANANIPQMSTTDMTIECVWKPISIDVGCCDTIFGRYDFRFFQIGTGLYTMIGFNNGGARQYQHPSYTISYNQWHHAVGMRRENRYIIWIDGVEKYNTTYGSGLDLWNDSTNWYVSATGHGSNNVALARVYNRGLSDTEILYNFNQIKNRYSL